LKSLNNKTVGSNKIRVKKAEEKTDEWATGVYSDAHSRFRAP
jgi:hypothetical protein